MGIIRGMRVTVSMIVGQVGAGRSVDSLLGDYPYLEREDILQALRHAACTRFLLPSSSPLVCGPRRNFPPL